MHRPQQTLLDKAASALRPGGHLLLDDHQHSDRSSETVFNGIGKSSYFTGTDDLGTSGQTIRYGGAYDPTTRIWVGVGHWELTTNSGESFTYGEKPRCKHIPSWEQLREWLSGAGLCIDRTYRNYTDDPLSEQEPDFARATIWARKP